MKYPVQLYLAAVLALLSFALVVGQDFFRSESERGLARLNSAGYSVVFDSRSGGNFGIYELSSSGKNKIYDSQYHDVVPSPSPDGSQIVFAHGKSSDSNKSFELWIINRDGSNSRKIVAEGYFPSFTADGKKVLFERRKKYVLLYDLANGVETVLFNPDDTVFRGSRIFMPKLSPNGRKLAFTSNYGGSYHSYLYDLETKVHTQIGHGCQPSWVGDNSEIFWVSDREALHRTAIKSFNITTGEYRTIVDSTEPHGIDYFPDLTPDSSLVTFSVASKNKNARDGDYDIFVKDTRSNEVFRLTTDALTNRWPRLIAKR